MSFPARPHISVILPVKNGLPHLKNAIEGLCAQTYQNFTLIVQDGVSTDGSLDYLRGLKPPFPIDIVSEVDGSLTIGYSRAMKRARGDLVVAAACDEVFDPDAFEQYVSWYQKTPEAVFIYGGSRLIAEDSVRGTMTQVFQPLEFNFVDYILQKMCPTAAGAYNRHVLGDELYLDESLKTCPDFELITRLALLYGPEKLITKKAITMSARGDRTSMTFRPEAHMQFVRDKSAVIRNIMNGPLAQKFRDALRNDFHYCLNLLSANIISGIEGDGPHFAAHLMAAEKALPKTAYVAALAHQSRRFTWDDQSNNVTAVDPPPPEKPVEGQVRVACPVSFSHFLMNKQWVELGAAFRGLPQGIEILTKKSPGMSAMLPLNVSGFDFENKWYWLYIQYRVAEGQPAFVVSGTCERVDVVNDAMHIMQHRPCSMTGYTETAFLFIKPCRSAALIISNTNPEGASRIVLTMAAMLEMPRTASSPLPKPLLAAKG